MFYQYDIKLVPAKSNSQTDYRNKEIVDAFKEACINSNNGQAFKREKKTFELKSYDKQEVVLTLTSANPISSPTRSISSITRTMSSHPVFEKYLKNDIYNGVFYNPYVIESSKEEDNTSMAKEDVLKTLIDMYMAPDPNVSSQVAALRDDTLKEIERLLVQYKNRLERFNDLT